MASITTEQAGVSQISQNGHVSPPDGMAAHAGIAYRPDIDGLRAIAVLSVIIFHARLGILDGGYAGVDIFFVISGFLITSILIADLEAGRFSISAFYERRVRRIFPALFLVIFATLAAGWWLAPPIDYILLGDSARATALFYSNLHFFWTTNYFAPASETQPLLHTWSLGVEEQFYIFAPFAIWFLFARRPQFRTYAILAALAASLSYSMYEVTREPSAAFYLLPSRAFELLIGMAIAAGTFRRPDTRLWREAAGAAGLGAIAATLVLYDSETPFPGIAALLPCFGAALVILSGQHGGTAVSRLLSLRPLVGIGKISYALYLWHWPLLAFAQYRWPDETTPQMRLALMVIATLLAFASTTWFETPLRKAFPGAPRWKVFVAAALAIATCVGFAFVLHATNGAVQRLSRDQIQALGRIPDRVTSQGVCALKRIEDAKSCVIGDKAAAPSFVFFGDSHAEAIAATVSEAARADHASGYIVFAHGCPPLLGLEDAASGKFKKCLSTGDLLRQVLDDPRIQTVIIHGRWAIWSEGARLVNEPRNVIRQFAPGDVQKNREDFAAHLRETVRQIVATGRRVVIIGPVPEANVDVRGAAELSVLSGQTTWQTPIAMTDFLNRQSAVLSVLKDLERMPGVAIIYPHTALCDQKSCAVAQDGVPLYIDNNHLNDLGADLLKDKLSAIFNRQ